MQDQISYFPLLRINGSNNMTIKYSSVVSTSCCMFAANETNGIFYIQPLVDLCGMEYPSSLSEVTMHTINCETAETAGYIYRPKPMSSPL